ncbi:MAG: histidine kinase, partial [Cyclobacteriaceae bacterium]|nr:histidine kinase [Cyclobacteriaceae bacterium]
AYENVYRAYLLNGNTDSAFVYQGRALVTKDSLHKAKMNSLAEFQNLSFGEQMRLLELQRENDAYQSKMVNYAMLTGLCFSILITVVLYRNNNEKKKTNKVLEETLSHLKSTQSQLIQSEKMASLGELTAGIAHEIQNPLNFVNNFSEVSHELLDEMKEEIDKGNYEEVKAISRDVKQNLEKILHHGKRADGIVKGMLQHSRSSSGTKEPTNINALADEYLRLAYHGLRAKDKSFNATMNTDYDQTMGNINIIPQDIGRVILNLITNAFYVVNERAKLHQPGYEPTVTVSTHYSLSSGEGRGEVIIKVKDNGNGIPDSIKEKIFQPFFSTKPTGQGTGLGLSLSYDIVKAHGGELKVETKEGEGSKFIITLPFKSRPN